MVVGVLTRSNRHGDMLFAYDVVREANVVEIVCFDHDVIEPALLGTDPESDRVIPIVTMHEHRRDDAGAHANFVFDATSHAQLRVKPPGRGGVILADNAMAEAAGPSVESPVHSPPRIKGLAALNF